MLYCRLVELAERQNFIAIQFRVLWLEGLQEEICVAIQNCIATGRQSSWAARRARAGAGGPERRRECLGARAGTARGAQAAAAQGARGRARQQEPARAERAGQGWLGGKRAGWP